jgi:hypothetical protein
MKTVNQLTFPKRFAMENHDVQTLPVVVVELDHRNKLVQHNFANLKMACSHIEDFNRYAGPMADMLNGQRCIRFESMAANERLSK